MKCCSVFLAEGCPQCELCLIECSKNRMCVPPAGCPRKVGLENELLNKEKHII